MLGVAKKLVKYVIHLSKRKNKIEKNIFLLIGYPNCKQPIFGLKEFEGLNQIYILFFIPFMFSKVF
jgi:hypothetical protein